VQAEIRFIEPRPTKGDIIRIVGRFGTQVLPDTEYEIVGIRDRDTFGHRLRTEGGECVMANKYQY